MVKRQRKEGGLIEIIVIVLIAIALLAYFNVDVRTAGDSIFVFLGKVWIIIKGAWIQYLAPLGTYLWMSITGLFN
ncbi:MAG: hypothetical protein AAB628_01790 [Patescibacteria group bacterium]